MLGRYVARRVLAAIPVFLGVTIVTFLLMHLTAGNYVPGLALNPDLTAKDIARIRANLGLDRPLYVQYLTWLGGILHGDFGTSLIDGTSVLGDILGRLPNTLELTGTAIFMGALVAIPLGVVSARRRGGALDNFLTLVSTVGFAVPQFWLGLLLILIFSVQFEAWHLPWLPSSGAYSAFNGGGPLDRLQHLILPGAVLSFFYISQWSRFVRSSMVEVLSQDYIRTAWAKGMSERRVTYLHALRNSILSLVTLVGLEIPGLIGGGLVVEVVFGWPGIGLLAYQRALQYDYTVVMGTTTFAALLVIVGNLLADVLYAWLDPRIRYR